MKKCQLLCFIILSRIADNTVSSAGLFDNARNLLDNSLEFIRGSASFRRDQQKYRSNELRDVTPSNNTEYDFIVVGAGSSGAAIAARLSENQQAKVLLIEAGGHETLPMDIPILALLLQLHREMNWEYLSEPSDDYCLAMENHQCRVSKGKVMGGTSTMNFMIATRGNKRDYDEWAEMTGDQSWSYEGMLKYFKKLENSNVTKAEIDPNYRNSNGPVHIVNSPHVTPLGEAFIEAGKEMGFPPVDYNGHKLTGFSYIQTNQINGERMSSNRAYLHPVKTRRNLFLTLRSHVTKVLIDSQTKTAYGVEFIKYGRKIRVLARKEVILAAGAIASPQILMLSGIGPTKHLQSLNIDVIVDAPVGENLMDHTAYGGLTFSVNETVGIVVRDFRNLSNPTVREYLTKRTGLLSTAGGVEGLGYVNVDDMRAENENPNMELMFTGVSMLSDYYIHVPFALTGDHWKQFSNLLHHHAWTIWPVLMKPKSRGRVFLNSSNPFDKPRIFQNYFSDPDDVRISVKGIRLAIEVSKTKAMQKYNSRLVDKTIPGCEKYERDSDMYWECALRTFTVSLWNHSGTCKMGRDDDATAVVNTKLQVNGISKLRVADTSIMPNIVTAHTNLPAIAIGEKCADMIKADWGYMN